MVPCGADPWTATGFESLGFDFMLKTATITWHAPLVFGETAALACSVQRWGNASFDVGIDGHGRRCSPGSTRRSPTSASRQGATARRAIPEVVRERLA